MGKQGKWITPEQWSRFDAALAEGNSINVASQRAAIHYNSGRKRIADMREAGHVVTVGHSIKPVPLGWGKLSDRAKRAYDDFEYFRRVYFGHISMPWQIEAAQQVVTSLEMPEESYFVWNMPPGAGKSTLTLDIAAWATVRNRAIRGLFGSLVAGNARKQTRRLARSLTATAPARAKPREIQLGTACDAEATLAGDYGLFKPAADGDMWRADEFIVVQADGRMIAEKEATWTAYGMDSGFLGNRYDLIFWDDVVDRSTVRTLTAQQEQREWWDEHAETRLDPGGSMFLVGQRIASNDLYRYCIDKTRPIDDDEYDNFDDMSDEEQNAILEQQPKMYSHVVFKAHDETKCKGKITHRREAKAWPDGCLLDPRRLHWQKLGLTRSNNPRIWSVQYQQEDADLENTLVRKAWVYGGMDVDDLTGIKYEAPGCVDDGRDGRPARGLCQLPEGLAGPLFSIATVDPSPTKMWALQWWVAAPNAFNQVFLMDAVRRSMGGNELLDYDPNRRVHYGLMDEWQRRSEELGIPIKHWVIEVNAAQRFLLQYQHIQLWAAEHKTALVPHTTTIRKLDDELGIDMVKDWWKYGRIRLPFAQGPAAMASLKLIEEVTRYPNAGTDDQVMAHWFLFVHLPALAHVRKDPGLQRRPRVLSTLPSGRSLSLIGAAR